MTVTPCPYPHLRPKFGPSCTEFVYPGILDILEGETSKIDDVHIEHGRLLYVLPLPVLLGFFLGGQEEGTTRLVVDRDKPKNSESGIIPTHKI